jgi:fructoselysine-6-phosphate deglycase
VAGLGWNNAIRERFFSRKGASWRCKEDFMLNFDESRYLSIQSGAIGLAEQIDTTIGELLSAGAENIFFLGTGGAALLMEPAAILLQRRSKFTAHLGHSAEIVITGAANLNDHSIVVIPSLSGTTPESITLLDAAKKVGAHVITLVGHKNTPLGERGDHVFVNFAEDDTSSESFYLQSLLIALAILKYRGEIDNYTQLVGEMAAVPKLLLEAKRMFDNDAHRPADIIAASDYHIFTGAGNSWPEAHYYAMCILEEMQWIRTRPVHAAHFFHGTLELVETGVSLFVFQGEDECRPLTERVIAFGKQYTDHLTVVDTANVELPGISKALRCLISPVVLAALLERVSAYLEVKRNHPLTTRRYYRRVPY